MKTVKISNADNLRELLSESSQEELTVELEKGVYEIEETINVKHCNVTVNGNGAVIKGSRKLNLSDCEKENGIVKIDLKKSGISSGSFGLGNSWGLNCFSDYEKLLDEYTVKTELNSFGTVICPTSWEAKRRGPGMEVFFNGKPMRLTRYPENDFMHIEQSFDLPDDKNYDKKLGDFYAENRGKFIPDDRKFTGFELADKALLVGNWRFDWATQKHEIEKIDSENNIIRVKPPYHGYGYNTGACFYALNVFEMLKSQVGSWFIDRENELLYVHPFENQEELEVSVCDNLFQGENVFGLSFNSLDITQCRLSAFLFKNSKNISVNSVNISNVGDYAIAGIDCTDFSVESCKIKSVGGGITLHSGDNEKLISSDNNISRNEITGVGRWQSVYMPAVDISGVGTKISGNYIHVIPHIAILYYGNNHIIERNEIARFCTETNDAGAIYTGRNISYYGNIIRNNYIHDAHGLNGKGVNALYFDDFSSSATCVGNIIVNVTNAVLVGGGHDHVFMHNIFSNCDFFVIDSRGKEWTEHGAASIFSYIKDLKKSNYKNRIWKEAFPKLYNADVESDDFLLPYGNEVIENTFINCGGIYYQENYHNRELINVKGNTFINRKKFDRNKHLSCHLVHYGNIFENNR